MKPWVPWRRPLVVWAARDLQRHPVPALFLFAALAVVTAQMTLVVLLHQSLAATVSRLTEKAPDVVVRRVSAGGWMPMPVVEGLAAAGQVAGVLRPRVRVWGVVGGPDGALTVVGVLPGREHDAGLPQGQSPPQRGTALIGPGVSGVRDPVALTLDGRRRLTFTVTARLPTAAWAAVHDAVLLHPEDARLLLGLTPDQASDLVLEVFHAEAVPALCADLAAAFPWPVHITTREEHRGRALHDIARRSSLALLATVPTLLAMALVVVALGAPGRRRRWESGLLKALGWSGEEILRLTLWRGLLVGLPAAATGLAAAWLLLNGPLSAWMAGMLFGWSGPSPAWHLTTPGSWFGLAMALLAVGLPYLAVVFWTGWRDAAADPAGCLEEGR